MAGKALHFKTVFRGESKVYTFTALDDQDLPTDISSASAIEFSINYPAGPPYAAVISKTLGAGAALLAQAGPTKGQFTVTLVPSDTASIDPLDYRVDVWVVLSGARKCVVSPSVWSLRDPVTAPV